MNKLDALNAAMLTMTNAVVDGAPIHEYITVRHDTIAALVAVAEAAWRLLHEDGYESELDAHLAPLVKEADDE